jgi:group I intron endonuclease
MQYEFIMPSELNFKEKKAGVYKMVLDKNWFYIGSSVNLWGRILKWKYRLRDNAPRNANIRKLLPEIKLVEFEIMEYVTDGSDPKIKEDLYIRNYDNYEFLLNRAKSAFTVKGAKRTDEEIAVLKERIKKAYKKVAIVDDNENIIQVFESVTAISKFLSMKISGAFKHKAITVAGKKLRKVDEAGNIIPVPDVPPKKIRAKGYKMPEGFSEKLRQINIQRYSSPQYEPPAHSKPVEQYDKEGNLIAIHRSIREAAKAIGLKDKSNLQKQLQGKWKYVKGFHFKYTA